MKRFLLSTVLTFSFLMNTFSQTTLSAGDLAVFLVQTRGVDDFAFVTFVDILPGTVIYFTDCGADVAGFNTPCTEGAFSFTVPSEGLNAGDIVRYSDDTNLFSIYTDSRITGTSFLLSTLGDQLIAFQDANSPQGSNNAGNNPRFIFVNNVESTVFSGDKSDSNETGLPSGLSDSATPRNALGLGNGPGPGDEFDTAIYNRTYDFSSGGIEAAKLAFSDLSNYYQTNAEDAQYTTALNAIPSKLILDNSLSSNQNLIRKNTEIYPNPVKDVLNISSRAKIKSLKIMDYIGREISVFKNIDTNFYQIETRELNNAVYFVKVEYTGGNNILRFIKK